MNSNKKSRKRKLILLLFLFLIVLFIILQIFGRKVSKSLKEYSKIEIEKFLNIIVQNVIHDKISYLSTDNIINVHKNDKDEIIYADFDNKMVNQILSESIEDVQKSLIAIENGKVDELSLPNSVFNSYDKLNKGIVIEVPLGNLTNNSIFYNVGPKVPVRIQLLGSIEGHINTNIEDYGINNSLVSMNMIISIKEQVILPINGDTIKVTVSIPLASKMIQGKIPTYYQDGLNANSSIFSLPTG